MSQAASLCAPSLERFPSPAKDRLGSETYLKAAEAFQTYRPLELKDFQKALSAGLG